ncbi:unnamed protein product, partial [Strongylus vulgaris]
KYTGGVRAVAGPKGTGVCFCSFPEAHVSNTIAFFDQVAGTALLMFFVCVVIDKRIDIPAAAHPFLIGCVIMMIGTSMGMNVGYPINPARDLGPRIFMLFIGYGSEAFTYHNNYSWIPVIAPFFGAVLAAWTYVALIGAHIPDAQPALDMDEAKQPLKSA